MLKSIKFYLAFFLVAPFAFVASENAQTNVSEKDLPNFAQVNSRLYRGAQPTETGVRELAKMGVKTIIDLRGEDKSSLREKEWARNAGIKFISVNLSHWMKPKAENIEQIIRQIDESANQPVFVHCKRGADRTGTVVAVYRISHDNYTAKQASDEAKRFGFGWWQFLMKDFINAYYKNFKVEN